MNKIKVLIICVLLIASYFLWNALIHPDPHGSSRVIIKVFAMRLDEYFIEFNKYPSTSEGLDVLKCGENIKKKYCVSLPKTDPWGNEINYLSPGIHNEDSYDIWIRHIHKADGKEYLWSNWEQ